MNVVFIMNDTWRYDHVRANGNDWISTPGLDQFAAESAVFDRSYIGSFATIPCRHDLLKGRYGEPLHYWRPLQWDCLTLPELLRENGYVTMLINDTPHMINYGYGFDRPFHAWQMIRGNEVDRYRTDWFEQWDLGNLDKYRVTSGMAQYHRQMRDKALEEQYFAPMVMDATCTWLERNAGHDGFFLWVDSFDPHEPWDPPQHYVDMYDPDYDGIEIFWPNYGRSSEMFTPEEQAHVGKLFAAECTMCDTHIGRVLTKIDNLGLRDNTIVVIMSDHGHYFGEHDRQSKSGPLYQEVSHQFLMIRHPHGIGAGQRFQSLTQPADFAPTILEMLGVEAPAAMGIQGKSLLGQMNGSGEAHRPVAISGSYPFETKPATGQSAARPVLDGDFGWSSLTVTGPEYSLVAFPEKERNELYHLPSDPGMTSNIIAANRDREAELHRELTAFLDSHDSPEWVTRLYDEGPGATVIPEIDDHLKLVRKRGMPLSATPLDGNVV